LAGAAVEWTGTRLRDLTHSMLVKFIFPEEKTLVQVIPDDAYATNMNRRVNRKTEMW